MKKNILAAITCLAIIFNIYPAWAAPSNLVQMKIEEKSVEAPLDDADLFNALLQDTEYKEQMEAAEAINSSENDGELDKKIKKLFRRQPANEKLLTELLQKQQGREIQNSSNNFVQSAPVIVSAAPIKRTPQESIAESTQDASLSAYGEADTTFFYTPGSLYKIYCREGFVSDIRLQPGEEIQYIGGGDTVRWVIDQAQSGSGNNKAWHIYLKPMKSGLKTNIVINTDKHSYQLHVESTDWYTPMVNWSYPQEEKVAFYKAQAMTQKHEDENLGGASLDSLNFSYQITKGASYDWTPTQIFDDGAKTYIKMPKVMSNAPVLFIKDGKNLALVNYRLKNGIYVVDRLFKEAELRNGSEIVRIKKK